MSLKANQYTLADGTVLTVSFSAPNGVSGAFFDGTDGAENSYWMSSDLQVFYVNPRYQIDQIPYTGFGTNDPQSRLHIVGDARVTRALIVEGGAEPDLSDAGQGRIYFDGAAFQASQNGGAYAPLSGGGSSAAGATASRYADANQALSSSVPSAVLFQQPDTSNEFNPTLVGVDYAAGVFTNNGATNVSLIVSVALTYQSAAGLTPQTWVQKNGDATQNYGRVNWDITGDRPLHAPTVAITLAPTEYFSVMAQQSSGLVKSLIYNAGPDDSASTKISVMRVSP